MTLLVASCLSSIMMLTTPIAPYNDDVMRRVFELMVGTLRDLYNSEGLTFGKKLQVLGIMAMTKTYEVTFNLKCDDLVLQTFQCFFSIRKHHLATIIAHMQSILSSCMRGRDAIGQELQSRLLLFGGGSSWSHLLLMT